MFAGVCYLSFLFSLLFSCVCGFIFCVFAGVCCVFCVFAGGEETEAKKRVCVLNVEEKGGV
jgi:hypothetical protein